MKSPLRQMGTDAFQVYAHVVPELDGRFIPVLRVSDLHASAEWYARVLCLVVGSRYAPTPGAGQVVLESPETGLTLCLVSGAAPEQGRFDEHRLGLDHLELLVPSVDELSLWTRHLDAQQVPHSGIKEPKHSKAAMVTFRDRDNIQLELFCVQR